MRFYLLAPLAFVFLLSGCADDDSGFGPDEDLAPQTFGIRHDRDLDQYETIGANQTPYDSAEYPDFSAVVAFSYSLDGSDEQEFVASGTLVRPNWILTAGHNFFDEDQEAPAPPGGIEILVGPDPNIPRGTYRVAQIVFHPRWNDDFPTAYDLCLVRLADPITTIEPANLNLEPSEDLGSTVWYSGFGDYTEQEGEDPDAFSLRHALENVLDRIGTDTFATVGGISYPGGVLAFDFDSPFGDINALGDGYINEEEAELGRGTSTAAATAFEGTTVEGDSGGPLFARLDGVWKVVGVLSQGINEPVEGHVDGDYGDISIFVRTAAHRQWIASVLE
jgi:V8-like Glu-specific endopeptidase